MPSEAVFTKRDRLYRLSRVCLNCVTLLYRHYGDFVSTLKGLGATLLYEHYKDFAKTFKCLFELLTQCDFSKTLYLFFLYLYSLSSQGRRPPASIKYFIHSFILPAWETGTQSVFHFLLGRV